MRRRGYVIGVIVALCLVAVALWLLRSPDDHYVARPSPSGSPSFELLERGRVLARLANCHACHTARGGEPFAGGRAIPTAFGTFYSPNITPDAQTGLGRWTERDFWRALHLGISRDGSLLYPAFPYPNFTKITQDDAHALWEYLKTVKPVSRRSDPHALRFPYKYRPLLRVWRAVYFEPGVFEPVSTQSASWNRGAYLAEAVAHCDLCHVPRNSMGAAQSSPDARGGRVLGWYAPALDRADEAGMQNWNPESIVDLLRAGRTTSEVSRQAATLGPMAEVVYESLQHAPRADIEAIATYLEALPEPASASSPRAPASPPSPAAKSRLDSGRAVYEDRCATCHGDAGEGRLPAALALANNRAVTMDPAVNVIRVVLYGGYPPGTAGNPQPFGMPPFAQDLSDDQIADVVSFIRASWGNRGSLVSADQVFRERTGPLW
jgi:mono/diheme cytochrome c family protein